MGPRASSDTDERLQVLLLGSIETFNSEMYFFCSLSLSLYSSNKNNKPQPRKAPYFDKWNLDVKIGDNWSFWDDRPKSNTCIIDC